MLSFALLSVAVVLGKPASATQPFLTYVMTLPCLIGALTCLPGLAHCSYCRLTAALRRLPVVLTAVLTRLFVVQLMWLLGPRGIPADWRHMEGFGVHTFKLVNKAGKETYVKFHWKPTCGVKVLTDDEAKEVGMANNVQSHATEDLWNTIESGMPLLHTPVQLLPHTSDWLLTG